MEPSRFGQRESAITIFDDPSFLEGLVAVPGNPPAVEMPLRRLYELVAAARQPTFAGDLELKHEWKARRGEYPLPCQQFESLIDAARARVDRLRAMNTLASPPTLKGELALVAGARCLPPNYHPNLPVRVRLAKARLERLQLVERLLTENGSDVRLAAAWQALGEVHGHGLLPVEQNERVALAVKRAGLLGRLQALEALSDFDRASQLVTLWDDYLLADCADAATLRLEWRRAREALGFAGSVEAACRNGDGHALNELLASPQYEQLMLPEELTALVEEFHQCRERRG
ncbi:MAG: hypothetical protein JSS27_17525 [Planctomycetes bacterium]|nr:hypothetical protein [Planctomycetota bacterium]